PGHRHIVPVPEAKQNLAADRVDADDPVREAAGIRDAVHDDRCAGDRATGADAPEDPAARGRYAVEDAVVRAEEDAPRPRRGRGVDVGARVDAPEVAPAG